MWCYRCNATATTPCILYNIHNGVQYEPGGGPINDACDTES